MPADLSAYLDETAFGKTALLGALLKMRLFFDGLVLSAIGAAGGAIAAVSAALVDVVPGAGAVFHRVQDGLTHARRLAARTGAGNVEDGGRCGDRTRGHRADNGPLYR